MIDEAVIPIGSFLMAQQKKMRAHRILWVLLLQLLLIAISIAAGTLLMIVYFVVAAIDTIPGMVILLLPLKIGGTLVQTAFGAALGNWYNASFVSAVEDETTPVRG